MSTVMDTGPISKQEAEEELSDMCGDFDEMMHRSAHAQWQMGRAYNYAEKHNLARLAGYKSTWDYFSSRVKGLTKQTLERYGFEAMCWDTQFPNYGFERLWALTKYLQFHGFGQPESPDPGVKIIRVPQPNGSFLLKPFADCTLDEVRRATQGHRPPRETPLPPPVPERVRWLYLMDSIRQYFQGVAPVRANMRYANGAVLVTMHDVPMREMERLIQALRAGLDAQPFALRDETNAPA